MTPWIIGVVIGLIIILEIAAWAIWVVYGPRRKDEEFLPGGGHYAGYAGSSGPPTPSWQEAVEDVDRLERERQIAAKAEK